jgi:hypothetical protein
MPAVEFIGASRADPDNVAANPARLVNCYREDAGDGKFVVKSVLGMVPFSTITGVFLRALEAVDGEIYAAHAGKLWRLGKDGVATELGAISDSVFTSISSNNGKVTVAAGGNYYVWDGEELTQPEDGAFSEAGSVGFAAQRTLITERGGRRVQWSALTDPSELGGLDFATTESRDDANLRVMPLGGEVWFFKEASIERWISTGTGFAALGGATVDRGLKAYQLLTRIDAGAFFVADNNRAYIAAAGGEMVRVSTTAVETSLSKEDPQTCFRYEDEGHEFCVVTFASRPAWVFDLLTNEWHEREQVNGVWAAKFSAFAFGKWFVADDAGKVSSLERTNRDGADPLIRKMVSRNLSQEGNRFRVARLMLNARVGAGQKSATLDSDTEVLEVEDGALGVADGVLEVSPPMPREVPSIMLRVSGDRGMTWGGPKVRSMGDLGDYDRLMIWRAFGQYRNFAVEVTCSEAIDAPIEASAVVDIA